MATSGHRESAVERIRARVEEKAARRAARGADREPPAQQDRATPDEQALPGITAGSPTEIPARGWRQIVRRALAENKADNMPIIGGGVAFFGFLAIFPALIATISIYGLVTSPATVAGQVAQFTKPLPRDTRTLLTEQLNGATSHSGGALTIGLIVSVLAALWSASSGISHLVTAVNIAYDEVETRGFLRLRMTSLLLTLGAIAFVGITLGLVAVVPPVLGALHLGVAGTVLAQVVRWVLLLTVMAGSLAVLYRVAPDRDAPKFRWVSLGSIVVTVAWAVVSLGFSFYVNNFGSYDKTYGAIAGVVVLMFWLYLTCYLILLGAEINAEAEHQTAQDTTEGEPQPMGRRDAVVADTLPDPRRREDGEHSPTTAG